MKDKRLTRIMLGLIIFFGILYLLSPVLIPFLIAGILAYLTDPLVLYLVELKIPRTIAVIMVFTVLLMILFILLLLLLPLLGQQITSFIYHLPQMIGSLQNKLIPWLNQYLDIKTAFDIQAFKAAIIDNWQQATSVVPVMWHALASSSYSLFMVLINLVLIPVVTFYLLRDWDSLLEAIQKSLPRKIEPLVVKLAGECDEVLSAFFRGQVLVISLLAIFYTFGLWLVGLQFALLIGVVAGLISIVPYLGFTMGLVIASLVALVQFHDVTHLLYVIFVFGIGHVVEGMFLTPWLIGDRIGLHPVMVIFAVLAGGQLFGFLGVLLALPTAAVIMVLLRHLHEVYLESKLYEKKN